MNNRDIPLAHNTLTERERQTVNEMMRLMENRLFAGVKSHPEKYRKATRPCQRRLPYREWKRVWRNNI